MAGGPCRMEDLKGVMGDCGFSPGVQDTIFASWRQGTIKQYDAALVKWDGFCKQKGVDPRQPAFETILEFLASLKDKGLSYSAVGTARSALSAYVTFGESSTVGGHPLVARFMKGCYEHNPPKAKYSSMWDVNLVFNKIRAWRSNRDMTMQQLTWKTVALLALVTAQRCQTLHALTVSKITWESDQVVFTLHKLLKHNKEGSTLDIFKVRKFEEDRRICPYRAVRDYLDRTKSVRDKQDQLFLSYGTDSRAVTKDTISRWLRLTLSAAGVNTTM